MRHPPLSTVPECPAHPAGNNNCITEGTGKKRKKDSTTKDTKSTKQARRKNLLRAFAREKPLLEFLRALRVLRGKFSSFFFRDSVVKIPSTLAIRRFAPQSKEFGHYAA
jgi:hypothetical protein